MKKPLIGVLPLYDTRRESYWMLPGYMLGLEAARAIPLVLPLTAEKETLARLVEELDGFLFTGGQDIAPAIYGEEALPACGEICPARDAMELELLRLALEKDRPVLGICRGIQIINAALGGTLYQDLPSQHPSALRHSQTPPYDAPCHGVELVPDSPLGRLLGKAGLMVNSYHHQAVRDLAPALRPMAAAPDGVTEAAWLPGKRFVWAVQWHPEFSYKTDEDSRKIFAAFVAACVRSGAASK